MTGEVSPEDTEALIAQFQKTDVKELHIKFEGFEIYLSRDGNAAGIDAGIGAAAQTPLAAPPAVVAQTVKAPVIADAAPDVTSFPAHMTIVRATYLGTFYRSPKPGAAPYVEVGSEVMPGTDLCLIEVMKLFTAIRAELKGRVHRILASDGEMVTQDQPLFVLDPA